MNTVIVSQFLFLLFLPRIHKTYYDMKKLFLFSIALMSVIVCTSCNGHLGDEDSISKTVALLLPDGNINPKWNTDAACITQAITSYGYTVKTYMADDSEEGAKEQVRQLEQVLEDGIKTVIITSIDYDAINQSGVLEKYPDINLISYDRLLVNCPYVDIFVGCNPTDIGKMQGHYILETFKAMGGTPKTVEILAGPPRDINCVEFYRGAFSLLESYFADKRLTAPSGKVAYEEVHIETLTTEDFKAEMAERLRSTGQVPDFVFCPNDNIADGAIQALKEYGCTLDKFPIITGLDNVGVSKQYILDGYQSMTIDKSLMSIADNVAIAVNGFLSGSPVHASFSFNNGLFDVPALFSTFSIVTKDDLLLE